MNNKISIGISEELKEVKGCVFKLYYGNRYIISFSNYLEWSLISIQTDINRYLKGTNLERSKKGLYFDLCDYVKSNSHMEFRVEVVAETDKGYQLLKICQQELDKAQYDSYCLNSSFEPYISKDIQRPANSRKRIWFINRGSYLNYLRWKKKTATSRF